MSNKIYVIGGNNLKPRRKFKKRDPNELIKSTMNRLEKRGVVKLLNPYENKDVELNSEFGEVAFTINKEYSKEDIVEIFNKIFKK